MVSRPSRVGSTAACAAVRSPPPRRSCFCDASATADKRATRLPCEVTVISSPACTRRRYSDSWFLRSRTVTSMTRLHLWPQASIVATTGKAASRVREPLMKDGRHIAFCDPEPSQLPTRYPPPPQPPYADTREPIMDILKYRPDGEGRCPESLRMAVGARLAEACRVDEIRPGGLTE